MVYLYALPWGVGQTRGSSSALIVVVTTTLVFNGGLINQSASFLPDLLFFFFPSLGTLLDYHTISCHLLFFFPTWLLL
ncbi:hypothetical protein QBC41DRAFT_327008 [Cercophora samala]|uniref:Uncharacterized protein n=1 Tax=Cercophora samala TaxID=330535 RepID=A0AA40D9S3_9PEZI|nr:hypothetical protein QBC41DRAFT_327008 [Cercophora samala]